MNLNSLIPLIERETGQSLQHCKVSALNGGDINAVYHLQTSTISWFIKVNQPSLAFMFEAEAAALTELAGVNVIRVPEVIHHGHTEECSYLILEYIKLNRLDSHSATRLGEQLAALHHHPQAFFGWHMDNTIGSTFQHNSRHHDWIEFWKSQRLLKQLQFAADKGYRGKLTTLGEQLADKIEFFFNDYQPHPVLLHGDLWSGNAAADDAGLPVIYDPASYYGDREADIAMTELFGGFDSNFYQAYQHHYPLNSGYKIRKKLYNLYHILNHLNLFGRTYLHQAESMIIQLLAET